MFINGMKIIAYDKLVIHKQVRFPKSKKKRIKKKWFKNSKNWRNFPDRNVYHISSPRALIMHPIIAEQFTKKIGTPRKTNIVIKSAKLPLWAYSRGWSLHKWR